jgi:hypothetical protein
MSPVPIAETERILIECLDNAQFRSAAASHLGRMHSHRAAAPLGRVLEEGVRGWEAFEVIRAISYLADPLAVTVLALMAEEGGGEESSIIAAAPLEPKKPSELSFVFSTPDGKPTGQ